MLDKTKGYPIGKQETFKGTRAEAAIRKRSFVNHIYISIGSNLGDRRWFIEAMERELRSLLADVKMSALMETEPVGVSGDQPCYLNRVIAGYYDGSPWQLLESCLGIESRLGRERGNKSGKKSRTADVDILLFGALELSGASLVIPHPQIVNRRFCLEGLRQIDSGLVVPGTGKSVGELWEEMGVEVRAQKVIFIE